MNATEFKNGCILEVTAVGFKGIAVVSLRVFGTIVVGIFQLGVLKLKFQVNQIAILEVPPTRYSLLLQVIKHPIRFRAGPLRRLIKRIP